MILTNAQALQVVQVIDRTLGKCAFFNNKRSAWRDLKWTYLRNARAVSIVKARLKELGVSFRHSRDKLRRFHTIRIEVCSEFSVRAARNTIKKAVPIINANKTLDANNWAGPFKTIGDAIEHMKLMCGTGYKGALWARTMYYINDGIDPETGRQWKKLPTGARWLKI